MATQTAVRDTTFTPSQALLIDQVGNEVYSSHYAERKLSRFIIGTQAALLLGQFRDDTLSRKPAGT
jgi:type IV secretion system protein VirB5